MTLRLIWFVLLAAVGWLTWTVFSAITPERPGNDEPQAGIEDGVRSVRTALPEAPQQQIGTEIIRPDIRNVTPDGMHRGSDLRGQEVVRLPAVQAPSPPERPAEPVMWKLPRVIAAGTLVSSGVLDQPPNETRISLADIDALAPDATCTDDAGEAWACGRFARAAMQRFVRNRTISCQPADAADGSNAITTLCELSGRDLSLWLVAQGWAVPSETDEAMNEALDRAKTERLGQWRKEVPRL